LDHLRSAADLSIRRACGFAGLGIGCTMLALAFDFALALRIGGDLLAMGCGILLLAAWWAPYRDLRHAEIWYLMPEWACDALRSKPRAEWVGVAAVAMWALSWVWRVVN
jgi:hypothetical protein